MNRIEKIFHCFDNIPVHKECSVKDCDGNSCPEEGVHEIGRDEYLCERCFKTYIQMLLDKKPGLGEPNETTLQAMKEAENGKGIKCKDVNDLIIKLNK